MAKGSSGFDKGGKKNIQNKLESMGYKIWEKGDKKRIYINDLQSFVDVKQIDKGDHHETVVNGINTYNYHRSSRKRLEAMLNGSASEKLYYDVKDKKFSWSSDGTKLKDDVIESIIKKVRGGSSKRKNNVRIRVY